MVPDGLQDLGSVLVVSAGHGPSRILCGATRRVVSADFLVGGEQGLDFVELSAGSGVLNIVPADHRPFPQGPGQPALQRQGPEAQLGRGERSLGFPQCALLALQDSQVAQGVAFAVCVA